MSQSAGDLQYQIETLCQWQRVNLFDVIGQVLAVDVLHHQVQVTVRFACVISSDNVGMFELNGSLNFSSKASLSHPRLMPLGTQQFECDGASKTTVKGSEDLPD